MPNQNDICRMCRGKYSEHTPETKHVFVGIDEAGELTTPQQREQARLRSPTVVMPPISGTDGQAIRRLIEVLNHKGLLLSSEALYILGVGDKPERPKNSQFLDPAISMGMKEL